MATSKMVPTTRVSDQGESSQVPIATSSDNHMIDNTPATGQWFKFHCWCFWDNDTNGNYRHLFEITLDTCDG